MPGAPRSAFPISFRTCSAKARSRRRSSRCTRGSCREARGAKPIAWRAPSRRSWLSWSRLIVLIGVLATPWLIDAIAPGFTGEKRELTIRIVRILFPGAGLLVLSAWCLGVLNSHHRFLLSVHGAGDVERRDDRDAADLRRAHAAAPTG